MWDCIFLALKWQNLPMDDVDENSSSDDLTYRAINRRTQEQEHGPPDATRGLRLCRFSHLSDRKPADPCLGKPGQVYGQKKLHGCLNLIDTVLVFAFTRFFSCCFPLTCQSFQRQCFCWFLHHCMLPLLNPAARIFNVGNCFRYVTWFIFSRLATFNCHL